MATLFTNEQLQYLNAMMDANFNRLEAKLEEQMRHFEVKLQQVLAGIAYTNLPAIGQSSQQQSTPLSPPQPITSQKKKRNQKTRLQYKRRSLQMVQEVEHLVEDSVDQSEVSLSVEASKRVVLKKIVVPWLLAVICQHAVTQRSEMSPVGSTADATGVAEMSRHGIG